MSELATVLDLIPSASSQQELACLYTAADDTTAVGQSDRYQALQLAMDLVQFNGSAMAAASSGKAGNTPADISAADNQLTSSAASGIAAAHTQTTQGGNDTAAGSSVGALSQALADATSEQNTAQGSSADLPAQQAISDGLQQQMQGSQNGQGNSGGTSSPCYSAPASNQLYTTLSSTQAQSGHPCSSYGLSATSTPVVANVQVVDKTSGASIANVGETLSCDFNVSNADLAQTTSSYYWVVINPNGTVTNPGYSSSDLPLTPAFSDSSVECVASAQSTEPYGQSASVTSSPFAVTFVAPSFSQGSGTYYYDTTVSITDITTGSSIYYTIGIGGPAATPTTTTGQLLGAGGTLVISQSETVSAVAAEPNGSTSAVVTENYTLDLVAPAAPQLTISSSGFQGFESLQATLTPVATGTATVGYLLLRSTDSSASFAPVPGTAYNNVGENFQSTTATIVGYGPSTVVNDTGLAQSTTYYYYAFAYDAYQKYSPVAMASASTTASCPSGQPGQNYISLSGGAPYFSPGNNGVDFGNFPMAYLGTSLYSTQVDTAATFTDLLSIAGPQEAPVNVHLPSILTSGSYGGLFVSSVSGSADGQTIDLFGTDNNNDSLLFESNDGGNTWSPIDLSGLESISGNELLNVARFGSLIHALVPDSSNSVSNLWTYDGATWTEDQTFPINSGTYYSLAGSVDGSKIVVADNNMPSTMLFKTSVGWSLVNPTQQNEIVQLQFSGSDLYALLYTFDGSGQQIAKWDDVAQTWNPFDYSLPVAASIYDIAGTQDGSTLFFNETTSGIFAQENIVCATNTNNSVAISPPSVSFTNTEIVSGSSLTNLFQVTLNTSTDIYLVVKSSVDPSTYSWVPSSGSDNDYQLTTIPGAITFSGYSSGTFRDTVPVGGAYYYTFYEVNEDLDIHAYYSPGVTIYVDPNEVATASFSQHGETLDNNGSSYYNISGSCADSSGSSSIYLYISNSENYYLPCTSTWQQQLYLSAGAPETLSLYDVNNGNLLDSTVVTTHPEAPEIISITEVKSVSLKQMTFAITPLDGTNWSPEIYYTYGSTEALTATPTNQSLKYKGEFTMSQPSGAPFCIKAVEYNPSTGLYSTVTTTSFVF